MSKLNAVIVRPAWVWSTGKRIETKRWKGGKQQQDEKREGPRSEAGKTPRDSLGCFNIKGDKKTNKMGGGGSSKGRKGKNCAQY